jgi:hypothetical protein
MTIPFLNVRPKSIKLKVSPRFPAQLVGRTGIDVTKENGNYFVDIDYGRFPVVSAIPPGADLLALSFDAGKQVYSLVPVDIFGAGGGLSDAPNDGNTYARQSGNWVQTLPLTGGGTITGSLTVSGTVSAANMAVSNAPVNATDVVNKSYVDTHVFVDAPNNATTYARKGAAWQPAMGTQQVLPSGSDFNAALADGFYVTADATCINTPVAGQYWYLQVQTMGADWLQIATTLYPGPYRTFVRNRTGEPVMHPWRQLLSSDDNIGGGVTRNQISTTSFPPNVNSFIANGYYATDDWGQGAIYVRGTSGGIGAIQSSDGTWWNLSENQRLSVGFFGARCDSSTDDAGAVQAALNAAQIFFGTVIFPGWCRIASGLNVTTGLITIEGDGWNCGLKPDNAVNAITINTPNEVILRDFAINYAASPSTGGAIVVTAASGSENKGSVFENLSIYGASSGINFIQASYYHVNKCEIFGCTYAIINRNNNNGDSGDSSIIDCLLLQSYNCAIYFGSSGGLRIANNKINVAPAGIIVGLDNGVTTTGLYIQGNSIEGISGDCIRLSRVGSTGSMFAIIISDNELVGQVGLNVISGAPWITGLSFTGGTFQGLAGGANILAKSDCAYGFTISNITFICGVGSSTNQRLNIGTNGGNGTVGPIQVTDPARAIASVVPGSIGITGIAPY